MRVISSKSTKVVEIEFNQQELEDLHAARNQLRMMAADTDLDSLDVKALENSIYLISSILGSHL